MSNKITCAYCGSETIAKRKSKKYCSESCKVAAYQKRKGIEPIFKPKPKNHSVGFISDVEKTKIKTNKIIKKISPLDIQIEKLKNEKEKLKKSFFRLIESNYVLEKTIFGATIGMAAGFITAETNKDAEARLNAFWGMLAGGILGNYIAKSNVSEHERRKNEKLQQLYNSINAISNEILALEAKKMLIKNKKIAINDKIEGLKIENIRVLDSKTLSEKHFETWEFKSQWLSFFGTPEYGFCCVIYGRPGQGKSTFALQFAKYLASNHGRVIYFSSEEGHTKTMANKLKENKHENLLISSAKNIVELEIDIRENPSPFIFIDSVNTYNLNVNQIEKLREDYPKISFILIYQSTKNGALRGSNEILHNSDILVRVENGMAETEKNRYNELSKVTIFA